MNPAFPALLALHAAVALFGFAALFGKWLVLPPAVIVLGRTLVAAIALAALAAWRRSLVPPDRGLAANGVVLAVHWLTFFEAIQVASVAIGLLGYATFPLFVLVLERVLLGRRWSSREASTALVGAAGLVVLVPSFDFGDATLRGLAWGTFSGATFAWLAVRSRRHAQTHAPVAVALWQNAFAALVLAPLAIVSSASWPDERDVALIVVLGLVCTALAHTLFIASLRRLSAHTASVVATLEPVYGIALAAWLLAEWPTGRTLVGAALILGAALVATRHAE
jgi:drug/metabolite transporter (DMT)-like permease